MTENDAADITGFTEPTVLLSIARSLQDGRSVYDATRFAWRVNVGRVGQYNLILAHDRGIVRGAFRPIRWLEANGENFPGDDLVMDKKKHPRKNHMPGRYGFVGTCAEAEVREHYVGKRVPDKYLGQYPVRYCHPGE